MNVNTVSVECAHRMCSQCCYEDCACHCHLFERLMDEEQQQESVEVSE